MDAKEFVIKRVDRIAKDMISIRDRIFAYAELPYREFRSSELLCRVLRQYAEAQLCWVEPGTVIGTVGHSALNEISQESHLHFAVTCNGVNQNPLDYLPA